MDTLRTIMYLAPRGMTMFAFSDILGDHQIYFGTEMVIDLKRSDIFSAMRT